MLKKSTFLCLALLLGLVACAAAWANFAVATSTPALHTIVLDAGHGGKDAGVVGVATGTKESELNLAVVRELKAYLIDAGFGVVMTRKSEAGLYGLPTQGFKMRDMRRRKEIIEQCAPDMVISVHQNFCPHPERRGGQAFYTLNSACGKKLAESIQERLNGMSSCVRPVSALVGDYYMLKCTDAPSVIVECAFLSNAEDDELMALPEHRKQVAYEIFCGIVAYFA